MNISHKLYLYTKKSKPQLIDTFIHHYLFSIFCLKYDITLKNILLPPQICFFFPASTQPISGLLISIIIFISISALSIFLYHTLCKQVNEIIKYSTALDFIYLRLESAFGNSLEELLIGYEKEAISLRFSRFFSICILIC